MTQQVEVEQRRIAFDRLGMPGGKPVFLLHGTPGSRKGPLPRGIVLQRLGIDLICYDRPGYGISDRKPGRTVADAAADVRAIAETLGLGSFCVVGRSGGGPHALACAAMLPEYVDRVAVLVGIAPPDADDLDWFAGMATHNVAEYSAAESAEQAEASIKRKADALRHDTEGMLRVLQPEMSPSDLRVVGDVAIRRLLVDTYDEALRSGPGGWIDDVLAFRRPWGFDLETIKAMTLFWHGKADLFSPTDHTKWMSRRIPGSRLVIQDGVAHFGALEVLPRVLKWITGSDESLGIFTEPAVV